MSEKRFFTFEEAAAMVMEDWDNESDEEVEIVVLPPENGYITDEENIDDTILATAGTDQNINDRAFDTAGELEVHGLNVNVNSCARNEELNDEYVEINQDHECTFSWEDLSWSKSQPSFTRISQNVEKQKIEELEQQLGGKTCTELFEEFFDENMYEYFVEQSNIYAHQNNRLSFSTNMYEMRAFIGFLLLTGYHHLPQEWMYWSLDPDISIPFVRETFSRQTYRNIKQNLHLANNLDNNNTDKLYKIRPFLKKLNSKFMKFNIFHHNLSIDEQMIPYMGRHSCKMYIHGKPIKFGYKSWTLASSDGYIYAFDIYEGKSTGNDVSNNLGLGGNVVLNLLSVIENPINHHVYFDNFFTSIQLLVKLGNLNYFATGTVRDNRIRKIQNLKSVKDFKKLQRGAYDFEYEKNNGILVVRWKDSAVVTIASNVHSIEPLKSVSRYSREQKKRISVPQPNVLSQYNSYMGGVDLADNFVSNYRISVRGKKWWWPFFSNFIDVALNIAWLLWRVIHLREKKTLLEFRREITIALMSN